MSALKRIADSSQTLPRVRKVPAAHKRTSRLEKADEKSRSIVSSDGVARYSIARWTSSVSVYMSKRASLPSATRQTCAKGARIALPVALLTPA